jgi:beta-lactam-binding protein with PASTA domain
MSTKDFFKKIFSGLLIGNLLAMAVVVVLLFLGVKYGLEIYTHHGEGIKVPNIEGMLYTKARSLILEDGLNIVVADSGYNKRLPAHCVLAQNPGEGTMVKSGHTIYVTVNSPSSPTFAIPDIVDNSSYREAEAKLSAIGFRLLPPKYVVGEKDWVYGVMSRGRRLSAGDMVSIDVPLTLIVGSGQYDQNEDIDYVEPEYREVQPDIDEFEEVTEP